MPKPHLGALAPYPLGESAAPGSDQVINLCNNEHAEAPSQAVLAACRGSLAHLNRYPDAGATTLRAAIAAAHGLDPAQIVCANGSSELITLLAHAYCGPGDEVLLAPRSYLFFSTATTIAGATPVRFPSELLGFDVDAALAAVTPGTRIVFVDNPGNPTGAALGRDALRELHAGLPPEVLLVLDAAYAEYVEIDDYEAGAERVDAGSNCVMLRTFSKIYGMAGARLGWAYAPPAIADVLQRMRQPNNLTTAAIAGGQVAVAEQDLMQARRSENTRVRDSFSTALRGMGLEVAQSHANFVLVGFRHAPYDAMAVYADLRLAGIVVRPMQAYGLPHHLRITIGTQTEMSTVFETLERILV